MPDHIEVHVTMAGRDEAEAICSAVVGGRFALIRGTTCPRSSSAAGTASCQEKFISHPVSLPGAG